MSTATAIVAALVGLVALTLGADLLVRGASRLAVHLGVSPLAVGLTVVAYGTSAPELVASVVASLEGHADVAVGNVLGSNLANTGLILGGTAVLAPVFVARSVLRRELPFMVAATLLFYGFGLRLSIGRGAGLACLALLAIFNLLALRWARRDAAASIELAQKRRNAGGTGSSVLLTLLGLALLLGGAHLLVLSSIDLARRMGISDFIIGVTLVAVGTSLPELATSLVAALRKEVDLVVGNIVGSNLFNILGALGLSAVFRPIPIDEALLRFEFPVLAVLTAAMVLFLRTGYRVSRFEGLALLSGYVAFVLVVVR